MAYRIIVTDLQNKIAKPSEPLHGATPKVGDIVPTHLGTAKVTKVRNGIAADDVYAQVQ